MSSKDKYTIKIKCPNCKGEGRLFISENDYPFMKKLNRKVEDVKGNFTASMASEESIKVVCNTCGEALVV